MEVKTQKEAVLAVLKQDGQITSWVAFKEFGITRLASIIHELRHKENFAIKSIDTKRKNRFGNSVVFSTYVLQDQLELTWEL